MLQPTNDDVLYALRKIMRPVVRLLVRNNITLQTFVDMLKDCYVAVAVETLEADRQKPTESRISVMTGVHRKDVKVIRDRKDNPEAPYKPPSMIAEVIARWLGVRDYADDAQQPRALAYHLQEASDAPTFARLAAEVSRDIHPRTLLDELIRLGYVDYDHVQDIVSLKTEALVPSEDMSEKLHYFGRNTGDHIQAAIVNIASSAPPFLDRAVFHDGLTKESALLLRKAAVDSAMRALKSVNAKAFDLSEKDKNAPDNKYRINLGAYFYSDAIDSTADKGKDK